MSVMALRFKFLITFAYAFDLFMKNHFLFRIFFNQRNLTLITT